MPHGLPTPGKPRGAPTCSPLQADRAWDHRAPLPQCRLLAGAQPHRFKLTSDDRIRKIRASVVTASDAPTTGQSVCRHARLDRASRDGAPYFKRP